MSDNKKSPPPANAPLVVSTGVRFFSAGAAACIAETCSLPLDTAKVRLQIQGEGGVAAASGGQPVPRKYRGLVGTMKTILVEEGPQGLFKGLTPGLLRQCVFATLRIGLYEPVRNLYHPPAVHGDSPPPLYKKIAAGFTTGTIGIAIANPTDLVKVRLQAEGRLPPGVSRRYSGTFNAFYSIAKNEGVLGLWKGVGPNIIRNSVITAAELATYDEAKQHILQSGLLKDNIFCHLLASTTAGFVATVVGSPVDVIKTRIMNQQIGPKGEKTYTSAFDCLVKIAKNEGLGGFYKGFVPNFGRIGSWNIVMFLSFEQIKRLLST